MKRVNSLCENCPKEASPSFICQEAFAWWIKGAKEYNGMSSMGDVPNNCPRYLEQLVMSQGKEKDDDQ